MDGLRDRSSRPHRQPRRLTPEAAAEILALREQTQRGQHGREVLRQAAGHHRVDRGVLHAALAACRGVPRDDLFGWAAGDGEKALDPLAGGRHDGQAVGPALLVAPVDRGEFVFQVV